MLSRSVASLCDPVHCRARQAPQSVEFSRPEYWSVLPLPSPGDLPNSGIACPALAGRVLYHWATREVIKPLQPLWFDPVLQSKRLREVEALAQAHTARIPASVGQLIWHPSLGSFVTDPKNPSLGHCRPHLGKKSRKALFTEPPQGPFPFSHFCSLETHPIRADPVGSLSLDLPLCACRE